MSPRRNIRVGKVARWQRRCTYGILGACALTGTVWFVAMDAFDLPPSRLTLWWIGHGIAGLLALIVLGAVLPHHVMSTWRSHRNRCAGGMSLGMLAVVSASAALLLYGPEAVHPLMHWCHVVVGLTAALAFPWHVLKGRTSVSQKV